MGPHNTLHPSGSRTLLTTITTIIITYCSPPILLGGTKDPNTPVQRVRPVKKPSICCAAVDKPDGVSVVLLASWAGRIESDGTDYKFPGFPVHGIGGVVC
jgi:hypothetical protein